MLEDTVEFTVSVTSERGELSRVSLHRIEENLRRAVEQNIKDEKLHRENLERRSLPGNADEALIAARVEGIRVQTGVLA